MLVGEDVQVGGVNRYDREWCVSGKELIGRIGTVENVCVEHFPLAGCWPVRNATQNPDLLVPGQDRRIQAQCSSEIRHRANGDERQFSGTLVGKPKDLIDRSFIRRMPARVRQTGISQSVVAMHVPAVDRIRNWTFVADCDGDLVQAKRIQDPDRIDRRLGRRAIAMGTADCDDLNVRLGREVDQHQRIVDSDVGIEDYLEQTGTCLP